MSIGPISAASLSHDLLATSGSNQLQQTLQTLQSSLTSGDLAGAQSAFRTLQQLNQGLTTAAGNASANSSQTSTDLAALGSALTSGDLTTAASALATVKSDFASATSPSLALEKTLASQASALVQGVLASLDTTATSTTTPDETTSLLDSVYKTGGSLSVTA